MALIKCEECTKEFSDKAAACPNCGAPTSSGTQHQLEKSPDERVYYDSDGIFVSGTLARFNETSYSINNINSVSVSAYEEIIKNNERLRANIGFSVFVGSMILSILIGFALSSFLVGFVLFIIGFALSFYLMGQYPDEKTNKFAVSFTTSSGNTKAYSSLDKDIIVEIVAAIQAAINQGVKSYS